MMFFHEIAIRILEPLCDMEIKSKNLTIRNCSSDSVYLHGLYSDLVFVIFSVESGSNVANEYLLC